MPATSIVFVDSRVSNYQSLIDSLTESYEVFILDWDNDGLDQMVAYLQGRVGLDAIHVISHGSQGALYLGNTMLNAGNLASYGAQLASIGKALTDSGDILLYGCDVAQGDVGVQFVTSLADLTGADIAASVDSTGAVVLGGDWMLEASVGQVDAAALNAAVDVGVLGVNTAPRFLAPSNDAVNSVALQSDGKIVLGGYSTDTSGFLDFSLIRLNTNGSLDTSFDGDGKVIVSAGTYNDYGDSVILQSDGKIVLAGYSDGKNGIYDFSMIRLLSNGSLDTSFDGDGKVSVPIGSIRRADASVVLQSNGGIVLANYSETIGNDDFSLNRLNANGTLDIGFDGDGKVIVPVGTSTDVGTSVALQSDGKIVLAGYSTGTSGNLDFSLIRLNTNGSLDASFDGDGKVIVPVGTSSTDVCKSVALQSDGKIVLAGYSIGVSGENGFSLVRLNTNGSLDTSFDDDGKVIVPVGTSSNDVGYSVAMQSDGKLVLAGYSTGTSGNLDFSLIRLHSNGSMDTSFDYDGKVSIPMGTAKGDGASVALQSDGKIVLAGYSTDRSGNYDFSLIRLNTDGTPDTLFGSQIFTTLNGTPTNTGAASVLLDADVQIYDAELQFASSYSDATLTLLRHGGADATDVFSAKTGGTLSTLTRGSYFSIGTTTIGLVVNNANGVLQLGFNANATQALVSSAMQQIAYATTASVPTALAQIDWTFDDGNTTAQGIGGALSVTGSTVVTNTVRNVNPVLVNALPDVTVVPGQYFARALPNNTFADANAGDPLRYTVAMANGTALPTWLLFDPATRTFSGNPGSPGMFDVKQFEITVTARDVANAAVSDMFRLSITSPNSLPTGMVTLAGTLNQGQTLTATNTLADADTIPASGIGALAYQWQADGSAISGATGSSLTLNQEQVGKVITVKASYIDGQGNTEGVTSTATNAVANVNDSPTGNVTLSGTPIQGETLTASHTLVDIDGIPSRGTGAVAYQWLAGGTVITSATGTSFTLTQAQVGRAITITASYTDNFGQTESVTSSATEAVGNVNDRPVGLVSITGTAIQGQTLNASNTLTDMDGIASTGPGAITYQWQSNGINIAGATGSALVLSQSEVGKTITVLAQYTDLLGTVEQVMSASVANVANINDAPSFAVKGGNLVVDFGGYDFSNQLAIQADGKIIVSGYSANGTSGTTDFAMVRFNPDGSLDKSFGTGGKLTTDFGADDHSISLTLLPQGQILLAGEVYTPPFTYPNVDLGMARYNADGTLDTSFGLDGKVTTNFGSFINDLTVQADGKVIVVGGTLGPRSDQNDLNMARYNPDGSLDTTFSDDGRLTIDRGGNEIFGRVQVQADGKILASTGGVFAIGQAVSYEVFRFNADGSVDETFDPTDPTSTVFIDKYALITVQADGKTLVRDHTSSNFMLARYNADGTLDESFGGTAGLQSNVTFVEDASPVILAPTAQIFDADLADVHYSGATLTLTRRGGANAQDVFWSQTGSDVMVDGIAIGQVSSQTQGSLSLIFNSNATQSALTAALQHITYSNTSDTPPATVQIDWTFSDGNTGAQGAGTALTAMGSSTVTIQPMNDAGSVAITGTPTQGRTLTATALDPDGLGAVTYQWQTGGTDISGATASTFTLTQAQVGKAITVKASYVDSQGTAESATSSATSAVANVNDAPAGGVTISGSVVAGQVLTASHTLTDPDGLGTVSYQWYAGADAISGATTPALALTQAQVNQPITVRATFTDGGGTAESVSSVATSPVAGREAQLDGMVYHWKSHALLDGVTVQANDDAAVATDNGPFDLRGASFDPGTGILTVELWANASTALESFDFRVGNSQVTAASFTSALPTADWTVLVNAENPTQVLVGAFLSNLQASGTTGVVKLGSLALTLPTGSTSSQTSFDNIYVGSVSSKAQALSLAAQDTGADGHYQFGLHLGNYSVLATRDTADSGSALTSADALAALRIAVELNPNTDPDGAGPLSAPAVSPYQFMAADVNASGTVTAADALAILRMAVNFKTAPPQEWLFVDEVRDFWNEATQSFSLTRQDAAWGRDITVGLGEDKTVNMVGVLKGDVNGSWTAPAGSADLGTIDPSYFQNLATLTGAPVDQWGL